MSCFLAINLFPFFSACFASQHLDISTGVLRKRSNRRRSGVVGGVSGLRWPEASSSESGLASSEPGTPTAADIVLLKSKRFCVGKFMEPRGGGFEGFSNFSCDVHWLHRRRAKLSLFQARLCDILNHYLRIIVSCLHN